MNWRMHKIIMLIILCLGFGNTSLAQEPMRVEESPVIQFLPFQPLPRGEAMRIRLENPGDTNLSGIIEIKPSDSGEFEWQGAEPIPAQLRGSNLRLESDRYLVPYTLQERDRREMSLIWQPVRRVFARPGLRVFTVDVRMLDESGRILSEALDVPVRVDIGSDTALSIAGTSGTLNADRTFAFIDFGELETGERAFIIFGAMANTNTQFLIRSDHAGALVSVDDDNHRIPYSAWFDGEPIGLTSEHVLPRSPAASLQGSRYRLDIQIGNVSEAYAGVYQDIITVEMLAN